MKTILLTILKTTLLLYFLICVSLFFFQEQLIFFPEKLDQTFQFQFDQKYQERNIRLAEGTILNGLLFKAENSKGLIFYLHGNAGSLKSWGRVAKTYTDLHYDVFLLDYRGYGKSEGSIKGQDQLFEDIQVAYDDLKKMYQEDKIIVLGYSIGTGLASKIASTNHPKLLILQAPYYNMTDMMQHSYPLLPAFILRYKFETNRYLKNCKIPIVIFHGDADEVIYYGSSVKLKEVFKKQDTLITLRGQGHNGITESEEYKIAVKKILAQ